MIHTIKSKSCLTSWGLNQYWKLVVFAFCISGYSQIANSAILAFEDFESGAAGWGDRDAGEMDVSWNGSAMLGEFEALDDPAVQTDAFRLTSGPFVGNLWAAYPDMYFTSWVFDFVILSMITPSDLIIRFSDGSSTFSQALSTGTGTKSVSLNSVAGWSGGNQTAFSNALGNIQYIDLQITRNGDAAQSYSFDNFTLNGEEFGSGDPGNGGGGPSAVPEPNTISLVIFVLMIGLVHRRIVVKTSNAMNSSGDNHPI